MQRTEKIAWCCDRDRAKQRTKHAACICMHVWVIQVSVFLKLRVQLTKLVMSSRSSPVTHANCTLFGYPKLSRVFISVSDGRTRVHFVRKTGRFMELIGGPICTFYKKIEAGQIPAVSRNCCF